MMSSKTKWAAFFAVGIMTVLGGVLLAASAGDPPAKGDPPVAQQKPEVSGTKEAKETPEPAWVKAFLKVYQMADDQYVKRIAPPYIDERVDFSVYRLGKKKVDPAEEEEARRSAIEYKMFHTLFIEQDGKKLSLRNSIWWTGLKDYHATEQQGNNLLTVWQAIGLVTGLETPEVALDANAKDDPLFADRPGNKYTFKGNKTVHGDFVTRKDAPLDKLVPQLEKILREECKLDVRLTLKEEEQQVFVVGGTFKLNPPAWRPKKELDIYAAEEGLNKEYDHFDVEKRNRHTGQFQFVKSSLSTGTPLSLVRFVGSRIQTRMVWDTPLPTTPKISYHNHTIRNPSEDEAAADRDPDKVLKVVSEQTGLTFKKEKRKVTVLYVGVPEK